MLSFGARFGSSIRFVSEAEWTQLGLASDTDVTRMGTCPTWHAKDVDQFVLRARTYTESVGPCIAGGLTGHLKDSLLAHPRHTGQFHLIPPTNLTDDSQRITEHKVNANHAAMDGDLGGLVVGGHTSNASYNNSERLANMLIGLIQRITGQMPSHFFGQGSDTWSRVGYDGRIDTWYIQTSDDRSPLTSDSLASVKALFTKRYVSPADQVFIGLASDTPIAPEEIQRP